MLKRCFFFFYHLGIVVFFSRLNEMKQTERRGKRNKPDEWECEEGRRITRKWTQDRAEKGGRPQFNSSRYIYIFLGKPIYIYIYWTNQTIERNILTRAREREGINSNFEGFPAYFCCWVIGKKKIWPTAVDTEVLQWK